jgi:hypothetical protein
VLGDLECDCEVEGPLHGEGPGEIARGERLRWDLGLRRVHPLAIYPLNLLDPLLA